MKGVLVGLGNPIVGDDSIGIRVVEAIKDSKEIPDNFTIIPDASLGGLPLVELIRGFDKAIIVDAVETRKAPPGSVKILNLSQYENSLHISDFSEESVVLCHLLCHRCAWRGDDESELFCGHEHQHTEHD